MFCQSIAIDGCYPDGYKKKYMEINKALLKNLKVIQIMKKNLADVMLTH